MTDQSVLMRERETDEACDAWDWIVASLAQELARNPAARRHEIAAHLLQACGYQLSDPLDPHQPIPDARITLTHRILGLDVRRDLA